MKFDNLLIDMRDKVALVTINRPKVLNALNGPTLEDLVQAFTALEEDRQVKAVVLTGAGNKAFVAGGDISFMQNLKPVAARNFALYGVRILNFIENFSKPVVAAINGFALGGGCELAMACDLRIAAETARFGQPEVNLGVIPGFSGTQRLPRLVGKGRAKELLYTGDSIDAAEAWRIGLVNKVVAPDQLLSSSMEMASKIAAKSPTALRLCKDAVNHGMEMALEQASIYEIDLFALTFSTRDQAEGMTAFLEKRPAVFTE